MRNGRGAFLPATVLADAGPGIPAYDREVFGPVACVTRFSTLDEAVELACDTEYGLALGIFTADVATGLALAERIPTGTAHINDQTLRDDAHVPFGGVRNSGNASRFGTAAANIEALVDPVCAQVQRNPGASQNKIVELLQALHRSRALKVSFQEKDVVEAIALAKEKGKLRREDDGKKGSAFRLFLLRKTDLRQPPPNLR